VSSGVPTRSDFLIIGGGIVGLSVALAIRRRWPGAAIVLLEKEGLCGQHASGRNSGVLHAGFYYAEDSLKARLTRIGNRRLTEYCLERELPIDRCGKLVVARTPEDLPRLDALANRAVANGVELYSVDESQAAEIEPRARTVDRALYSPATAVVDPGPVVEALAADAADLGITFATSTCYQGLDGTDVLTSRGRYSSGFVVNAAGLYADRVAHDHGFGTDYRILPFKGLYLNSVGIGPPIRAHVYPVPDPRYPFLGVHFTRTAAGGLKIGPTAIPALWREQYHVLGGFRFDEFRQIGLTETRMFMSNTLGFRSLAWSEMRKYSKRGLMKLASRLIPDVWSNRKWIWGRPGIRAQLYHVDRQELVEDFVLEGDSRSIHVLNAVSPAFTCALPFADLVVDEMDRCISGRQPDRTPSAGPPQ